MKRYLEETFLYNDHANKLALAKMHEVEDSRECVRHFSHMINSMNKWLGRIEHRPGYVEMDWWLPEYRLEDLEEKWNACLAEWLAFLNAQDEEGVEKEVEFVGFDGTPFAARVVDIALQLNYHAIHHRAQIQYFIRQQGVEPEFVDFIATKYRRV